MGRALTDWFAETLLVFSVWYFKLFPLQAEGISVNFELASADPGTGGCRFKAIKAVAYV